MAPLVALALLAAVLVLVCEATKGIYGIDLGWENSVVATPRHSGIEVLWNEDTGKTVPSLVAFHGTRRVFGELVHEIGYRMRRGAKRVSPINVKDLLFDRYTRDANSELLDLKNEHVVGMFIGHLLTSSSVSAEEETGENGECVCVCVPALAPMLYKTRLANACRTQSISKPIILHEGTALALSYGFFQPEEGIVMFLDIGHQLSQVTVAVVSLDSVRILAHASTRDVSASVFDDAVLEHVNHCIQIRNATNDTSTSTTEQSLGSEPAFAHDMRTFLGIDEVRMEWLLRRAKEMLATHKYIILQKGQDENSRGDTSNVLELSSTSEDIVLDRDTIDALCLQRMKSPLQHVIAAALKKAGVELDGLKLVEIVGGGSLIHSIRIVLDDVIGVEKARRTISPMFSVARGAALYAAMHSQTLKVRPFAVKDVLTEDIIVCWQADDVPCTSVLQDTDNTAELRSVHGANGSILIRAGMELPYHTNIRVHSRKAICISIYAGEQRIAELNATNVRDVESDAVSIRLKIVVDGVPEVTSVSSWSGDDASIEENEWLIENAQVGEMSSEDMRVCVELETSLRANEKQRLEVLQGILWTTSFMDQFMSDVTTGTLRGVLSTEEAEDVVQFFNAATNKLEQDDVTIEEVRKVAQECVALKAEVEAKRTELASVRAYISQMTYMMKVLTEDSAGKTGKGRNKSKSLEQLKSWLQKAQQEMDSTPVTKALSFTLNEVKRKLNNLQNLYDSIETDQTVTPSAE